MRGAGVEEVLPLITAARRLGVRPDELRRRLITAEVIQVDGGMEAEMRATDLVAIRRARTSSSGVPRWWVLAEAERRRRSSTGGEE